MALRVNLDDLINARTVESVRIEFKKGWNPHNVLRTVCAFANDIDELGGGYVIVGIEEKNGTPILPPTGIEQKDLDSIQQEFFKLCQDNLEPQLFPPIEVVEFQGKYIIVIWTTTGEQRPYKASVSLAKGAKKVMYVRHGSTTKEADEHQQRQLQELAAFKHFDDRVNERATIDDLDLGLIQAYLQEAKSDLYSESLKTPLVDLALKMQIARGPKENIRPLNVGLLLFCRDPLRFFEGCKTNLIIFDDEAGTRYTEKVFDGPVHLQIRNIMAYMQSNVIKRNVKKTPLKPDSEVFYNYPYQALEEVIVNAVYHRSYEEKRPNEIRIYNYFEKGIDRAEDSRRIEIRSYPGPLPPIDNTALQQLRFTSRNYRNIKLGDWLKNIRLAEKYATGIPTILESLEQNGSPVPFFWTDDTKSEFLVVIKCHEDTLVNEGRDVIDEVSLFLTNTQQQILEIVKKEPATKRAIQRRIKMKNDDDIEFLERNLLIGTKKVWFSTVVFITQKGIDILKISF